MTVTEMLARAEPFDVDAMAGIVAVPILRPSSALPTKVTIVESVLIKTILGLETSAPVLVVAVTEIGTFAPPAIVSGPFGEMTTFAGGSGTVTGGADGSLPPPPHPAASIANVRRSRLESTAEHAAGARVWEGRHLLGRYDFYKF